MAGGAGSRSREPAPSSAATFQKKRLANNDQFGVQSTLHQFSDLLVWGLVCVIVVCSTVAVWSVYKNSRGRSRSLRGEHGRVGE